MVLTRFWLVLSGLVVGAALFLLSMAQSMYNRAGFRAMGEGLQADSQVVSWYLRDDARMRSGHLVKFALDTDLARGLSSASKSETKLPESYKDSVEAALKKVNATIPEAEAFDAVFAVDQHGRVVGHIGYPQASGMDDFELGGYPVVADALHGFIRDDTLVLGRMYRVVARPVELEVGDRPAGAIIGARMIDDAFARELSSRTGAAVAFYVGGQRVAAGAPEEFPKASLDQIISDMGQMEAEDTDYKEKGRSGVREIAGVQPIGIQYTRLSGEAYVLGAGYAVGRMSSSIPSPLAFFTAADDKDKEGANQPLAGGVALGIILLGLLFSVLEHTRPLRVFEKEALRLARGEVDQLQVSRFRGFYRKIAAELNDGIDKVASTHGGVSRKAADLEQVLGELPAQPMMAAFAVPGGDSFGSSPAPGPVSGNIPVSASGIPASSPTPPARNRPPLPGQKAPVQEDPEAEWPAVFDQFVQLKVQCGESVENFTYDKFRGTLIKNRDALVARHGASAVKFSVYIKDGRAALKASPVR